jgi:hypothetical protein
MAVLGKGPDRATGDALFAEALAQKEAVLLVMGVRPGCRGDVDVRDHGADAHRLPHGGDQAVAETEGPQT